MTSLPSSPLELGDVFSMVAAVFRLRRIAASVASCVSSSVGCFEATAAAAGLFLVAGRAGLELDWGCGLPLSAEAVTCIDSPDVNRRDLHQFARIVRIITLLHVVSHVTSYRMSIIFSILYSIYRLLLDDGSVCFIPLLMEVAPRNEQSANCINSRDTRRW